MCFDRLVFDLFHQFFRIAFDDRQRVNYISFFEKEELYTSTVYVSRYELNNYIKNYLEQFNLYARKRQINIIFETNFESQEVWLDRNKMDSIIPSE